MMPQGDFLFITTEREYSRIKNVLEAIDHGDSDLYFENRRLWNEVHEKVPIRKPRPKKVKKIYNITPLMRSERIDVIRRNCSAFRECFGKMDTHRFCQNICCIREECMEASL